MPSATALATPIALVSAIPTVPVSAIPSVPVFAVPIAPILMGPSEFLSSSLISFLRIYCSKLMVSRFMLLVRLVSYYPFSVRGGQ